ncbi:MAG: hypothetical protein OHK0017_00330 [Patescibacteria group bacterium]
MSHKISEQEAKEAWDYWYPLVYGYFFRRLNAREDVEDLTANTLSALLLHEDVKNPRAFVWQTARNQLVEFIKQKSKAPKLVNLDSAEFMLENYQVEEHLYDENEYSDDYKEKVLRVTQCIENSLKDEDYRIVRLSILENRNSTEVGELMEMKAATVRQKLKRAILKLKEKCIQIWTELSHQTS